MKNLSVEWIIKQIYKYKFIFLLGIFLGTGTTLTIYKLLPKKYKTVGKINVSPKYFQNPMMMDFLPTVYDASELRSEREAAIAGALSREFLMTIFKHENPNNQPLDPIQMNLQLEKLKNSFEIFRDSTTVFQIGAVANSSEKSYDLCTALISEIIYKTRTARTKYLEQMRDAVKARLQSLNRAEMTSTSVNEIKHQIDILEKEKKKLLLDFNPNHPDVFAIASKINSLKSMSNGGVVRDRVYDTRSIDPTQKANNDVKARLEEDLMKKYQNLEIVLDLENSENNTYVSVITPPLHSTSPVSPKLTIFLVFGLLIGLFLGIMLVAFHSREEMLNEIGKDSFYIDSLNEKKKDRRSSGNRDKNYTPMDQ